MFDRLVPRRRWLNLAGFLICASVLAAAYYLQYVHDLEPCPLCIFQRIAFAALGIFFLLAALQNPRGGGRYVYALLIALAAGIGAFVAGRHVRLQSLPPDQVPACGPGLNYLLDTFPLAEALTLVLRGSGECAEVDTVLGLSIPLWALLAFIGLGLAGVLINLAGGRPRRP
jgi:disulfide bond formation protein DsbB